MGNIYGVANPLPVQASFGTVGAADVSCPAATETTVITAASVAALNNGDYYPSLEGVLIIYLGATAPTALVLAFKLGSGSDVQTYTVDPGQLVNSAKIVVPYNFVGANDANAWIGSGSTINLTCKPTGQAVTVKNVGSYMQVQLFRGPDA